MSLSGSERSSQSCERQSRQGTRQRKLFRKRDKRSRSSERYEFSDLEDEVFVRGPRKLRREDLEGELSYDYTNPGHLKVFTKGLHRAAGQPEFRTVLVSAAATAVDIIGEVLQRSDVLYTEGDEFFLCEVIGKLEPYQQHHLHHHHHHATASEFVEQCRRIIGPEEHVLVIQALWKPLYGYYRRFELRQVSRDETAGLGSQRRRCLRLRAPCEADDSEDSWEDEDLGRKRYRGKALLYRCHVATQVEPGDPPTLGRCRTRGFGTQTETIYFASADLRLRRKCPIPLGPYLLLVKGFDSRHDQLVNDLYDVNLLGSNDRRCDVHLRCADVLPEHCIIEACHSVVEGDTDSRGGGDCRVVKPYCMSIAPIGPAEVLLNGQLIDRKHFLTPGDVISIGAGQMCSYVFMFKDASQVPDRSLGLGWLMFLESAQKSIDLHHLLEGGASGSEVTRLQEQQQDQQHCDLRQLERQGLLHRPKAAGAASSSFVSTTVPSDSVLDNSRQEAAGSCGDVGCTINREADAQQLVQSSLGSLLALYFGEAVDLEFAAGLLVLVAVYSADLDLELAAGEIQWHITDSVVTLSKKASQMQDLRDKAQCFTEMIHACALAFEVFLFFHEVCASGLTAAAVKCQQWRDFCETTMQQMLENIFNQLGEEILAQSAALCDIGFGGYGQRITEEPGPNMESFITLLTQVSQAFTNAQYQCVSTLRLMIMKRLVFQIAKNFTQRMFSEDSPGFLKWNCAIQLRVNLDQLEEWLRQEGLDRFLTSLDLPNSLVDLLATPKSQLVTMSWQVLRKAFPLIPPSLLRCTLAEYESRSGPVNGVWSMSNEDRKESEYSVTCAIEDHFQLAIEQCHIPVEEVKSTVQLLQQLENAEFNQLLQHLDKQTGASNCRLQWHQVASHVMGRIKLDERRHAADSQAPGRLGGLFSQPSQASAANSAIAAVAAVTAEDNRAGGALFYDSLSECSDEARPLSNSGDRSPVELLLDEVQDARVEPPPQKERQPPQRPKTPTPPNVFAAADNPDVSLEEDVSSLTDSFTLANTFRNEMHAHRLDSRGPVVSPSAESLAASECLLYLQHTRSFVAAPSPPLPPPPPPRSCSLNSRRGPAALVRYAADEETTEEDEVFLVTLNRLPGQSFGMELIDGEKTQLGQSGVFVRALVPGTPAASCRRLEPGDRIVAVNSQSLVRLAYPKCLEVMKKSDSVLHLLIARPTAEAVARVLANP